MLRKKTERICGQDFPREVVKSTMLKVDINVLENAIEQMKRADNVRNYEELSYQHSVQRSQRQAVQGKMLRDGGLSMLSKRDFGVYDD